MAWNGSSIIDKLEEELGTDSTLYWLFISIFAAMIWIVYLTYYNSRVIGLFLTLIINRFVKFGHLKIGSFSVSVLSGKVMFRDVHLITEDFSLRVQLGFAIFRWWRPLTQKGINEDLSHSETRLSIYFDTFELHTYNRSALYTKLEEIFGLDQQIIPAKDEKDKPDKGPDKNQTQQNNKPKWQWRDLIPVVKFEISTGKLVFGNYLLPTTLSINFRDAHIVYTTKPASTPFDQFMHIMKCRADNLRVMFVPSPKFSGPSLDEAPRLMGEGYVVLLSNNVDIYYYQDEPGLVPYEPELVQLANGDVIARRTWPCMGMDVKCGKGTDISYGPWADRRREELWKFFFPPNYQPLEVTKIPEPGQRRIHRTFDFKLSMQTDSTVDILFTKNKETQAVHFNMRQGTYVEVTMPWISEESGYLSKINGQFMHVDATTSLQFRSLLEAETLEFEIDIQYPRNWNDHQDWKLDFIASKASVFFIYHHKIFFNDLIEDWSSKAIPDLFHFVPYTMRFNILMRKFELVTLANEHNWIDCFGQTPENAHIAFTGETFDMSFNLPFIDYLPPVVPIKFFIRGESVDCLLFLPETNTSRHILMAMAAHNKIMGRDGTVLDMPFVGNMDKWRSKTQKSLGWIDCWTTPIVALSIGYSYHPIPPVGDDPMRPLEEPITTPDAEEQLLIPLRLVPLHPRPRKFQSIETAEFDRTQMEPDQITLELEVGPSVLCVYGSLLGNFLHVKENYLGEDQGFKDLQEGFSTKEKATSLTSLLLNESKEKKFDPRHYRPLHVKVQVTLHDIQAHLIKNCNDDGPPCPCIYLERLGFEMDKQYIETKLQVLISPAILVVKDDSVRPLHHNELKDGHLTLSGLQVRGHALFSHEGLPLDNETLEYAWMVEVTVGDITGRLTVPQLQSVVEALQTFVFLVEDSENTLQRREPFRIETCRRGSFQICQHGVSQASCTAEPKYTFLCPTEEAIKYRLTRASVDCIDLYLVEAGTALNLQVYPIRVSTCNLHGKNNKAGVTVLVPHFNIKQFIYSLPPNQEVEARCPQDMWLEAGGFSFGPLTVDAAMALPSPEFHVIQGSFLKLHDKNTHRLWFLWPPDSSQISPKVVGKCGCLGGCTFFGKNRNGLRFFNPTDQDFMESYSTAVFNIITQGVDYGYGQSLLQVNQLVFDIQSTAMPTSPIKAKMMSKRGFRTSKSSVDTNTTLVDDNVSHRQSSLLSYISDRSIDRAAVKQSEISFSGSDHTVVALAKTDENGETGTSSVDTGSLPSDVPEGPGLDVCDTDHLISSPSETGMSWVSGGTGSVTSLPEASGAVRRTFGHERKLSYDAMKRQQSTRRSDNGQSPLVGSPNSYTHGSKSSIPSSVGYEFRSISRQSSLTSPVLRRLSSQFSVQNEGSLVSMSTGSERFFSAYEDVITSGEDLSSPPYRTLSSTHSDANSSSLTSVDSPTGFLQTGILLEGNSSSSESVTSFVSARTSPSQSQRDLTKVPSQPDILKDVKASGILDDQEDRHTSTTMDGDDGTNTTFDQEELDDMGNESTINYVDLHGQINQQITRSPLLMSCYNNHMNRLQCSHWSTKIDPAFSSKVSSSYTPAPVWIPQFSYRKEGFSPGLMVDKREIKPVIMSFPSTASDKSQKNVFGGNLEEEEQLGFTYEDHVSKTTAVVKLKGSVDILISPLMLESLQRFVESVTPVLANMHPSAIVDALHFQCSSNVISQHKLRKKESKNECPDKTTEKGGHSAKGESSPDGQPEANSRTSRMQVMFSLSRINISVLQVSLVEEIIDFSVLEHARELTCVSVLAACIDDISLQVLSNSYAQKSEDGSSDASPDSINKRLPGVGMDGGRDKKKQDPLYGEDSDQCAETQEEDTVGILKVGRVHFQLRRMKKDFNDAVSLTAIPEYKSKVLFTFSRQGSQDHQPSPSRMGVADNVIPEELEADDVAGFIMFECGLEDINIKAAKRSGYKSQVAVEEEDAVQQADKNLNDAEAKTSDEKPKFGLHDTKESDVGSVEGSQQSERGNSADDEASSWQSRVSVESEGTGEIPEPPATQDLHGDASSCSIGFKEIWFNFAAPPVSSNKRKLVYTRFDWNLLSTVSPAINSWMQPAHRVIQSVKTLMTQRRDRMNTVMACMMTEGLEVQSIHMPHKSKYGKITSLSRIVQEDPSCQLFTVLRRYIKHVGINVVEDNLNVDTVPQLITIQKGLLALTRQWKNILYMPLLVDTSFKNKKRVHPYTVAFTIPKEESIDHFNMDDGEATLDNFEVVDEKTSLLKAEGGSVHHGSLSSLTGSAPQLERPASAIQLNQNTSPEPQPISANVSSESVRKTASGNILKGGQSKSSNMARMSPQFGSVDSPARLTSASQRSQSFGLQGAPSGSAILNVPKMQRNESNMSFVSASISASSDHGPVSVPGTPLKQSLTKQLSELDKREDEDLYRWMQRQQEYTKFCTQPGLNIYPSLGHESFINTGISEYSQDDNISMQGLALAPFLHLADARVLFRPLLKGLGVHLGSVKSSAFMKKFGGNVSIQGTLKKLRVLIVDSESQANTKIKTKAGKGRIKRLPKLQLEAGLEPAAFQCDMFGVTISMKDVVDFEKEKQDAVMAHDLRRRSLRAIKFAMEHMEAKPTTTKVYFSMNCDSIQPHVNMSLLRLTHQFISMAENINETRIELTGKRDNYKTHRKQDSKGSSTGTESQSVDATEPAKTDSNPLESIDTPTPDSSGLEAAPKLPKADEHRPDKLPLFTPSSKSPSKKFSLKRSINRFQESLEKQSSSITSPLHSFNMNDSVAIEMVDTSSPVLAEKTIMDEIKANTPKCWRTLYHLLELYSTMPETKTLERRPSASRLSVIDEEPEKVSQTQSIAQGSSTHVNKVNVEEVERQPTGTLPQQPPPIRPHVGTFTQSVFIRDQIPLVVFGSGKVRRINITATLSGLKLEAEVLNVHASATHRERIKAVLKRKSQESSATVHVGRAMIELREGLPPNTQTVVTINVAKSQGLYSSMMRRSKEHNSALVTIGNIMVDIPQHPVVLHGMVARSSRRLSNTLQEFWRPPTKVRSFDNVDSGLPSQQPSKHSDLNEYMTGPGGAAAPGLAEDEPDKKAEEKSKKQSVIIHFKAFLQGLTIGASLLPSLKAQYKMGKVSSSGVTGKKARFNVNLPNHSLSFSSKFTFATDVKLSDDSVFVDTPNTKDIPPPDPLSSETPRRVIMRRKRADSDPSVSTPSTLPSSASIDLPPIHIHADYRPYTADTLNTDGGLTEGLVLREGSYLNAVAEVGAFEHSLTTDLLNHLVFVQKVFMKEVNEVVQKVSGADQPVPLWEEGHAGPKETTMPLLYSLQFQLKRIQITATTPTSCAVRLETGSIELEVSNRVQTANKDGTSQANKHVQPKVFLKAQVDLNLALGLLLKNPLYEEMEAEFQNLASFTTRIALRNALQDEMIPGVSRDQEALLISLKRPVVFIQPAAFDKAVLVWLNYKNAYEYWNEQRLALNKEVQTATQQVIDKLPLSSITQTNVQGFGTLFLQLTVDDLGICLPLSPTGQSSNPMKIIDDGGAALVLTLVSTQISACSCGSLVSKGRFTGFCLRFADDFEVSWDDWKPAENLQYVMNAMVVPEGTYEVCSQTANAQPNDPSSNPKWFLNITWQMKGLDVHLDHNIGKRLSALGTTLTSFTGDQPEEEDYKILEESEEETETELPTIKVDGPNRKLTTLPEGLPEMAYDTSLDAKTRARIIEKEMNEQAKIVQDLKQLGASQNTIAGEEKKLTELQSAVFNDFRQEILKRLKRQSVKATAIKDKLGLGLKPTHVRSKSTDIAPGTAVLQGPAKKKERRVVSYVDREDPAVQARARSFDHTTVQFDISPKDSPEGLNDEEEGFFVNGEDAHKLPGRHSAFMRPSMQDVPESSSDSEEEDPDLAFLRKSARRQRGSSNTRVPSPSAGSMSSQKAWLSGFEPNVDFEADIHVEIDMGQCVLHPKERSDIDLDSKSGKSSAKKENKDYMSSPHSQRKAKKKSSLDNIGVASAGKYSRLPLGQQQPQMDNTTVFFMPGVDVRVHYDSKTSSAGTAESPTSGSKPDVDSTTPGFASTDGTDSSTSTGRKGSSKKANLYAWLSLQKLSEEMLISPVLLDFLEQALEPIPMIQLIQGKTNKSANSTYNDQDELDASASSLVSSSSNAYASFPVDVVVYIRVQASLVRFTCLPVSRVECLLRLPSLDLVFSTKRADAESNFLPDTSPPPKNKSSGTKLGGFSARDSAPRSSTRTRAASGHAHTSQAESMLGGGLSVTGCLTDFSLYIFHPYGHGHKKTTLSALENSFRKGKGLDDSGSTIQDPSTRKDSLSLNVEFVKVNISRSRRGVLQSEIRSVSDTKAANIVRFSAVCDIGSASFKYDMRRLSEILALPKAWYRRSLARRMFLGEENVTNVFDESEEDDLLGVGSSSPGTPDNPRLSFSRAQTMSTLHTSHLDDDKPSHRRVASEDRNVSLNLDFKRELDDLNPSRSHSGTGTGTGSGSSPQSPSDDKYQIPTIHASRIHSGPSSRHSADSPHLSTRLRDLEHLTKKSSPFTTPIVPGKANKDWETLVLFAVNLARLDVAVNMSNVMGNTVWQTKNLKSQGRLSIDSTGFKDMKISANVSGSKLEARGGIVGGHIELHELSTYVSVNEEPDHEPDHSAGVQFFVLETKLDYMGSSVLMGRISDFNTTLSDEWRLDINQLQKSAPLATKRPAVAFVHGDMSWDCFHLLISRSTTPDIIKMVAKLDEFFTQQLNSSKRALSAFGPIPGARKAPQRRKSSIDDAAWISEIRHHRHWQKVLELVSGCKLSMLQHALPEKATILGGTMSLHGNNLSLACYHGINFRSKSWALFTMSEPIICFATEAQDVNAQDGKSTHIVQNLSFQLGHNLAEKRHERHMATILKVSRGHYMPPPFTSVSDWFHYAFASTETKDLENFPQVTPMGSESPMERPRLSSRKTDYNHDTEIIFELPSLEMHLKTEHLQTEREPTENEPKPVVVCSFVTQFEDHIFVAMDAEVIFFLHDLVTNYVKEKDRGTRASVSRSPQSPETERKNLTDPTSVLKQDYREFDCKTWHLEPTVRLISWAGKRIDPVGVDYILQKLGFQHARLTIPKWMQRGAMDPLDMILSVLVKKLIHVLRETDENK